MIAVKGIYQGGNTVKLDSSFEPVNEQYEVVVAFLNPANHSKNHDKAEEKLARRQEGFQHFMQYRGTLPADFDYKKELADYRDERHGYID